jgi:hypothetical protein
MDNEKLNQLLNEICESEILKMKESVKRVIELENPNGLEQSIGRRNGFLWESIVKTTFGNLKPNQTKGIVLFSEFVKMFVDDYIEINNLDENCSMYVRDIVQKFFEISGTDKQDLCDFVFVKNDSEKYAIDTKWRFISNDAKTVRQIAFSAIQLKKLGFIPILLVKRPAKESLESPLKRFSKSGWLVYHDEDSLNFVKQMTDFDLKKYIEENVNKWDSLSEYHTELISFHKKNTSFEF